MDFYQYNVKSTWKSKGIGRHRRLNDTSLPRWLARRCGSDSFILEAYLQTQSTPFIQKPSKSRPPFPINKFETIHVYIYPEIRITFHTRLKFTDLVAHANFFTAVMEIQKEKKKSINWML